MGLKNGKDRTSKFGQNSNIRNTESNSRIMGNAATASAKHGSYQIAVNGENSDKSDSIVTRQQSFEGIPGKIIGQLVEETEKQLAYHEQQAEVLRDRLKELKQIPESLTDVKHTE